MKFIPDILTGFRYLVPMIALSGLSFAMSAQEIIVPDGYELADSVIYRRTAGVDSSLVGKSIFNVLPSKANGDNADVKVYQSKAVLDTLQNHIVSNASRKISGYRVRIFFDNRQSSRTESEAAEKKFTALHPGYPAYRSYANPYFKVTVGDFRTKSEAMELLEVIKPEFPAAFIVKENIEYPAVDKDVRYVADTVKVLRPVASEISL